MQVKHFQVRLHLLLAQVGHKRAELHLLIFPTFVLDIGVYQENSILIKGHLYERLM